MSEPWPAECPGCHPELDAMSYIAVRCASHPGPVLDGRDDGRVTYVPLPSGGAESGGETNAAFCELLHRKRHLIRG